MRIWLDAQTAKQARLMVSIARRLRELGHEVLITTRRYDFAHGIVARSGLPYRIIGEYGGASLAEKLRADLERMEGLLRLAYEWDPDVLIAYPIPASTRVAYGLGKPIILLSDSPHSAPVHRLTVPLARYLVYSRLIPLQLYKQYLVEGVEPVGFWGVEEWEWVAGHRCDPRLVENLGLQGEDYIVVRTAEAKAVYYRGRRVPSTAAIILEALRRGYRVVAFPRYDDDLALLRRLASENPGRIIVLHGNPVETLDLYCYAYGVVTGGATMAREASLLCKPAVSLYPVYINLVLEKMGLPIRNLDDHDPQRVLDALEEARGRCNRSLLERFEKPSDVVAGLLGRLETRGNS